MKINSQKFNVKGFKGKCYACDRVGHRRDKCTYSSKQDGSPLNPKKSSTTPTHAIDQIVSPTVETTACGSLDVVDISVLDVVDPWVVSGDPWQPPCHFHWETVEETYSPTQVPLPPRYSPTQLRELQTWLCAPASVLKPSPHG